MTQSRFSYRVLTSFFVTFDFLILLVTGVVLYVVPHGRVANWINWELMGLSKDQWTSVHILSALLFLLVSILHLIFNWKPFKHYFFNTNSREFTALGNLAWLCWSAGFSSIQEWVLSSLWPMFLIGESPSRNPGWISKPMTNPGDSPRCNRWPLF